MGEEKNHKILSPVLERKCRKTISSQIYDITNPNNRMNWCMLCCRSYIGPPALHLLSPDHCESASIPYLNGITQKASEILEEEKERFPYKKNLRVEITWWLLGLRLYKKKSWRHHHKHANYKKEIEELFNKDFKITSLCRKQECIIKEEQKMSLPENPNREISEAPIVFEFDTWTKEISPYEIQEEIPQKPMPVTITKLPKKMTRTKTVVPNYHKTVLSLIKMKVIQPTNKKPNIICNTDYLHFLCKNIKGTFDIIREGNSIIINQNIKNSQHWNTNDSGSQVENFLLNKSISNKKVYKITSHDYEFATVFIIAEVDSVYRDKTGKHITLEIKTKKNISSKKKLFTKKTLVQLFALQADYVDIYSLTESDNHISISKRDKQHRFIVKELYETKEVAFNNIKSTIYNGFRELTGRFF